MKKIYDHSNSPNIGQATLYTDYQASSMTIKDLNEYAGENIHSEFDFIYVQMVSPTAYVHTRSSILCISWRGGIYYLTDLSDGEVRFFEDWKFPDGTWDKEDMFYVLPKGTKVKAEYVI